MMEEVKEQLFEILKKVSGGQGKSQEEVILSKELAGLMRRRFPAERSRVAEITNPDRFAIQGDGHTTNQKEWIHPSLRDKEQGEPAVTTAEVEPTPSAKKKAAAALVEVLDDGSTREVPLESLLELDDEDILESFDHNLAEVKRFISETLGGEVARNAKKEATIARLRELIEARVDG